MIRALVAAVVWALLVVLIPAAVIVTYARDQILDSDQFMSSISPLADDTDIQNAIADHLIAALDEQVASYEASGDTGSGVASDAYRAQRGKMVDVIHGVVESSAFESVWNSATRTAHRLLVSLLTGRSTDSINSENGAVQFNTGPLLKQVRDQLRSLGINSLDGIELTPEQTSFTLYESEFLADAKQWTRWIDRAARVIPIVTIVFAIAFLTLATRKLRAIVMLALAAILGTAMVWVALFFGRDLAVAQIDDPNSRLAARAIYDSVMGPLRETSGNLTTAAASIGMISLVLYFLKRPSRGY